MACCTRPRPTAVIAPAWPSEVHRNAVVACVPCDTFDSKAAARQLSEQFNVGVCHLWAQNAAALQALVVANAVTAVLLGKVQGLV